MVSVLVISGHLMQRSAACRIRKLRAAALNSAVNTAGSGFWGRLHPQFKMNLLRGVVADWTDEAASAITWYPSLGWLLEFISTASF